MKRLLSLGLLISMLLNVFASITYVGAEIDEVALKTIAFPGAEGGGMYATGARGALETGEDIEVYHVTTLNDNGVGSFRDAVSEGNRIIVFDISGNIQLNSILSIKSNNLTILGQTAPGDGICFSKNHIKVSGKNIILRYLRFRLGDSSGVTQDGLEITDNAEKIIIDHCSVSWGIDENLTAYAVKDVTIQWSIISEALNRSLHDKGDHGYASLWGGVNLTVHHSLIAHHTSRNPRISSSETTAMYGGLQDKDGLIDLRNNVIYNWGANSGYGGENGVRVNIVNNYYKPGPATTSSKKSRIFEVYAGNKYSPGWGTTLYVDGNYVFDSPEVTADNWYTGKNGGVDIRPDVINWTKLEEEDDTFLVDYPINTQTAQEAYNDVLEFAGATLPKRDSVDKRVVESVRLGAAPNLEPTMTGTHGSSSLVDSVVDVGGYPEYNTAQSPLDTDNDGIPDEWEDKMGLSKENPNDSINIGPSGYMWLEIYIEEVLTKDGKDSITAPDVELLLGNPIDSLPYVIKEGTGITFEAVSDNSTYVEFYANGDLLGKSEDGNLGKYSLSANLKSGIHYITAKAYNADGEYSLSPVKMVYVVKDGEISPWNQKDIGSSGKAGLIGYAGMENENFIISGTGDMNSTSSGFNYLYQEVTGDFDLVGEISDVSNHANDMNSGIMVRNSLEADSEFAMISYLYKDYKKDVQIGKITSSGDRPEWETVSKEDVKNQKLFKISKQANELKLYTSNSLSNWGEPVSTVDISTWGNNPIYAGAAVDSGSLSTYTISKFARLRIITQADITNPKISITNLEKDGRIYFDEIIQLSVEADGNAAIDEVEIYFINSIYPDGVLMGKYEVDGKLAGVTNISIPISFSELNLPNGRTFDGQRGELKAICYDENLGTATDSVMVSVSERLAPWEVVDIGNTKIPSFLNKRPDTTYTYRIYSQGEIGGREDAFAYFYQQFEGDSRIYFRNRLQGNGGTGFGLMIKEDLEPDSKAYFFGAENSSGKSYYNFKSRKQKGEEYITTETDFSTGYTTSTYLIAEKIGKTLNIYKCSNNKYTDGKELLDTIDIEIGDKYYMGFAAAAETDGAFSDVGEFAMESLLNIDNNSVKFDFNYGPDWFWRHQDYNILNSKWTSDTIAGNDTGMLILNSDESYDKDTYIYRMFSITEPPIINSEFKILLSGENPGVNFYWQSTATRQAFKVGFADGVIKANADILKNKDGADLEYTLYKWYTVKLVTNVSESSDKCDLYVYESDSYNGERTLVGSLEGMGYSSDFRIINEVNTKQPIGQSVYFEPIAGSNGVYYFDDIKIVGGYPTVIGDINNDGKINLKDVITYLQYTAGTNLEFYHDRADINEDTAYDNRDITYLLRALAGYSPEKNILLDEYFS